MIVAQRMNLLDDDRTIARGIAPIDMAEGPPAVICWDGATYVLRGWCLDGSLDYRRARVFHAGASFEAVR